MRLTGCGRHGLDMSKPLVGRGWPWARALLHDITRQCHGVEAAVGDEAFRSAERARLPQRMRRLPFGTREADLSWPKSGRRKWQDQPIGQQGRNAERTANPGRDCRDGCGNRPYGCQEGCLGGGVLGLNRHIAFDEGNDIAAPCARGLPEHTRQWVPGAHHILARRLCSVSRTPRSAETERDRAGSAVGMR
jgi:hypothetical protein